MTVDTPLEPPLTIEGVGHVLAPLLARRGWSLPGGLEHIGGGRSALTLSGWLHRIGHQSVEVVVRAERYGDGRLGLVTTPDHGALLEAVRAHGVLAPRPLLAEDVSVDGGLIGLLVTELIAGEVPNPWRRSGRCAIAGLRRDPRFLHDFVDQLVRIHEVPIRALPAGLVGHGPAPAATYDIRLADRAAAVVADQPAIRHDPVFTHALRWAAHPPASDSRHGGLVHGDYRMGNVVVDDGQVVGILDWELAEVGDTVSDVGWLHGAQARTDGLVGGLFDGTELVEAYRQASGRSLDDSLVDRHASLGTLRTAAVWVALSPWSLLTRADPAAIRALLSIVQSKPLLWSATRPDPAPDHAERDPSPAGGGTPGRSLRDGALAGFSGLLAKAMGTGGAGSDLLDRSVRQFLAGQAELLGSPDWAAYDRIATDLVTEAGPGWPGAHLTSHLRASHEGPDARTVQALDLAARPGPALGDVLCGFAAAGGGDVGAAT